MSWIVSLRRLGAVLVRRRWALHLRLMWDVLETHWWEVVINSPWDIFTTFQYDVVKAIHWDVLATFHWGVVGCFSWDTPTTSLGRTETRRYNVRTTSCCRVGGLSISISVFFISIANKFSAKKFCNIIWFWY